MVVIIGDLPCCPKNPGMSFSEGIIAKILLFSDGIGTQNILFDREYGFLGLNQAKRCEANKKTRTFHEILVV